MAPPFKQELTDRQEAFAKNFGKDLMTMTGAAKAAGYADPNGEIDRLMGNRAVAAKVIEYLRSSAIKWSHLVAKAKGVLAQAMDATKSIYAKDGTVIATVEDMKARLEAARIVLLTLKRDGGVLLEDAAEKEDNAATTIELARRIVGPSPTPAPGTETEN